MVKLTNEIIDQASLTEAVRRPGAGAVVTFLGTVRDVTGESISVALEYEAHGPMATAIMADIEKKVREQWPIQEMAIVHRLGKLEVGEISVAIAVSTPHRAQAFEACRYAIDRLKELVPIWKKEYWAHGQSEWIHPQS